VRQTRRQSFARFAKEIAMLKKLATVTLAAAALALTFGAAPAAAAPQPVDAPPAAALLPEPPSLNGCPASNQTRERDGYQYLYYFLRIYSPNQAIWIGEYRVYRSAAGTPWREIGIREYRC
jgi:hypothetical protein